MLLKKFRVLERFWTRRHPDLPSFTLGAAAYLDIPAGGMPQYLRTKMPGNKILASHFGALHERMIDALTQTLGEPVHLTDRFALPGFHIYGHDPNMVGLKPVIHWDLQDTRLPDWEGKDRTSNEVLSFTLPIRVPTTGAGIKIWKIHFGQFDYEEALLEAKRNEPELHSYAVGELFIHGGDLLHQISTETLPGPNEVRLTLQGHGRRGSSGWELYW